MTEVQASCHSAVTIWQVCYQFVVGFWLLACICDCTYLVCMCGLGHARTRRPARRQRPRAQRTNCRSEKIVLLSHWKY